MASEVRFTQYGDFVADFVEDSLAQLCDPVSGVQTGPFGSQLHQKDYVVGGTPIVTVEHLGDNRIIHEGVPCVSDEDKRRLGKYILRKGDIVFSRVGSVDRRAVVRQAEDGWLFSGRCLRVRPDPSKINSAYLSYFFGLPSFKEYIRAIAVGATMPSLNTQILSSVVVPHPRDLDEQRAIAYILGTLDDKIELNRRMNETLEAIARAIFDSWFVDFDPVRAKPEGRDPGMPKHIADLFPDSFEDSELGEIPRGWRIGRVGEFATLSRSGIDPGEFPDEIFDHFSIPAFDEGRRPKSEPGVAIKSNKFLVPGDSVLLSKLNPRIPRIWLPTSSSCHRAVCSTEFLVTLPRAGISREFLYSFLASQAFSAVFETLVTGTSGSHQRIKPEGFLSMNATIPDDRIVEQFTRVIRPLLTRFNLSREEAATLAALRDMLLPKLLSGELKISSATTELAKGY
jgi:type I restriction enzyme S subunit